ncbi:hypothetical protein BGX23_006344 [Mortierella sp. AD031]|nr:hypothetical protein BGX23_006344 [Mortierella sp. AD031]
MEGPQPVLGDPLAVPGNPGTPPPDDEVASMIRQLPAFRHFELECNEFKRLFNTVRTLRMQLCRQFTSRMALDVLLHCVHLEDFETYQISLSDLQSTLQPWACQGLKRLKVFFASDPDEPGNNTLLFEQLSRLRRLESLDVGLNTAYGLNGQDIDERASQWRLDSGISQLSTLTRLERFNFANTKQELREEDVEWMLEHWPLLESIGDDFSSDEETQDRLRALAKQRGIRIA